MLRKYSIEETETLVKWTGRTLAGQIYPQRDVRFSEVLSAFFSSSSFVWEGTDEISMNSSWGSSMFSFSRLGRSSGSFSRLMVLPL